MLIVPQHQQSVLFITLDSCRYDTFVATNAPNLKTVGKLYRAMAPGYFTYASHQAMFVGFTPGRAAEIEPFINPKYSKIFRMAGSAAFSQKTGEPFTLGGKNIIDGFKSQGYLTIGSGAVGWFNPETETARALIQDFDLFYYPGDTYSLARQIEWISQHLHDSSQKVFVFLNIGETHTPYYYQGAAWSPEDNPCIPFGQKNNAQECRQRQQACLEYVDRQLEPLLKAFGRGTIFICADHGDCWGEDGLWEHGFCHEKVLEVPLIFKLGAKIDSDLNFPTTARELSLLEKCQSQVSELENQLQIARAQLNQAEAAIIALKSSKFWKLRKIWFKLKGLVSWRRTKI
jgi:hypothetical protein